MLFNVAYAIAWLGVAFRVAEAPVWIWLTLYVPALIICLVDTGIRVYLWYEWMLRDLLQDEANEH